jgi:hypothetical protein
MGADFDLNNRRENSGRKELNRGIRLGVGSSCAGQLHQGDRSVCVLEA